VLKNNAYIKIIFCLLMSSQQVDAKVYSSQAALLGFGGPAAIVAANIPGYFAYKKIKKQPINKTEFKKDLKTLRSVSIAIPNLLNPINKYQRKNARKIIKQHKFLAACIVAEILGITICAARGILKEKAAKEEYIETEVQKIIAAVIAQEDDETLKATKKDSIEAEVQRIIAEAEIGDVEEEEEPADDAAAAKEPYEWSCPANRGNTCFASATCNALAAHPKIETICQRQERVPSDTDPEPETINQYATLIHLTDFPASSIRTQELTDEEHLQERIYDLRQSTDSEETAAKRKIAKIMFKQKESKRLTCGDKKFLRQQVAANKKRKEKQIKDAINTKNSDLTETIQEASLSEAQYGALQAIQKHQSQEKVRTKLKAVIGSIRSGEDDEECSVKFDAFIGVFNSYVGRYTSSEINASTFPGRQHCASEFLGTLGEILHLDNHPSLESCRITTQNTRQLYKPEDTATAVENAEKSGVPECLPCLPLQIADTDITSVQKAFDHYSTKERVGFGDTGTEEEKRKDILNRITDDDGQKKPAIKWPELVETPPEILTFSLNRFEFDPKIGRSTKPKKSVTLDDEVKIPFTQANGAKQETTYKPKAVVVHKGPTPASGHYYTYVRSDTGKWTKHDDLGNHFTDTSSQPIPAGRVFPDPAKHAIDKFALDDIATNGYIFVYEKIGE